MKVKDIGLLILLGIVLNSCASLTFNGSSITKVSAGPVHGFTSDYYLYIPPKIAVKTILVIPNNSGFISDDVSKHEEKVKRDIATYGNLLAEKLQCVLLIPVFPRSETDWNVYTHALDRETLHMPQGNRLDEQLINMIRHARNERLSKIGEFDEKVFLFGFSASGMFVNRFTVLHPDIVRAVACGAPGGWPIAPLSEYRGEKLPYPVGVSDLEELTGRSPELENLRDVPQFYFLGEKDTNDSVPYSDGYSVDQRDVVFRLFGKDLVERFRRAAEIYSEVCTNVRFAIYPNVDHRINGKMVDDAVSFYRSSL